MATEARAAQQAVISAGENRRKATAERRTVFIHEHEVKKRSYGNIALEVGLTRARVVQIIKGRNR
jgi:hypothetical protein